MQSIFISILQFPIVLPACFAVAVFTLVLFSTIFEPKATSFGVVIVILTGTPYYLLFVKQIVKFPKMNKLAGTNSATHNECKKTTTSEACEVINDNTLSANQMTVIYTISLYNTIRKCRI